MNETVLIVPGYLGSGPAHWQTWLESRLPEARRATGINWDIPVLTEWTAAINQNVYACKGRIWIVAHSFGCLASAVVASERTDRVAGVLFVAPADPERFSAQGVRSSVLESGLTPMLPFRSITPVQSILVASENDPWLQYDQAQLWANRWGSRLVNIGRAGHVNTESGFGPWPVIMVLLAKLKAHGSPAITDPCSSQHSVIASVTAPAPRATIFHS
jgi:uncharacterized protein